MMNSQKNIHKKKQDQILCKQEQNIISNFFQNENPLLFITNPHSFCYNKQQNICDQVSGKRRNQFIQPFEYIKLKNDLFLTRTKEKQIIGLIPNIHRSIIDLNRNVSKSTRHFKVFDYILDKFCKIIVLDIHSYSREDSWGTKADRNTDLVILYPPNMNLEKLIEKLKEHCKRFKIVSLLGGENTLINHASEKNHVSLLLEFPDFGDDDRANLLINRINDFFLNLK